MSTESGERIEETAGEWLARRELGVWSAHDQQTFDAWLNTSMRHRVAYWRLESAWEATSRLKALGAGISSDRPSPPGEWNLSPFYSRSKTGLLKSESQVDVAPRGSEESTADSCSQGARHSHDGRDDGRSRNGGRWADSRLRAWATSLLLASAITAAWLAWPESDRYETTIGAITLLPIADGSKVILNTASEIKIALNDKERRIELKHGEAFFDVAKDPARPFVVVAGEKRIVAVGTKFSVRRNLDRGSDDIQVVVTEGAVRVESSNGRSIEKLSKRPLTAGTVAHANRDGLMVQHKALPEAEEQLAWRDGVLVLRRMTLAEAAAEFNRYNKRKIVIEDPAAARLAIEGSFRTTEVEAFVRLLERGYPVAAEMDEGKIVVRAE